MGFFPEGFGSLVTSLVPPMLRLIGTMAVSLLVAQALESFGWTRFMARLASPLVRFGRLTPVAGAAFSLSFVSPSAANAMLAEGVATGVVGRKELFLANIINSTPAFLLHLPSLAATAFAFIGDQALVYVGLVFGAALVRTVGAVVLGRLLLPLQEEHTPASMIAERSVSLRNMLGRFKRRLIKMCLFTVPVYCLVFAAQRAGLFEAARSFLAVHSGTLFFLHPGAAGVVVLYLAADTGAAFAAAAALLHGGGISPDQVVMALLIGNILSSPMRAFRHQLPSYAGFFSPGVAFALVSLNQSLRAVTLALAAAGLYWARMV